VFFAKTSRETTQLRGFLCASSSSGLASAGNLAPGSFQRAESIDAVRFSIGIVVVGLTRCFCFAKTFVAVAALFWGLIVASLGHIA